GQFLVAASRSGHRADALAAYRTAYQLLSRELGVEPSAELRQIHAQVLAGELVGTAGPRAAGPGAGSGAGRGSGRARAAGHAGGGEDGH
ncbi:BTAD domain-containing putative transcriptional regulator, partial [Frankia sp. EI5c]|uniref:AfsR/SARP family transcriptional regulator n=1 Tax=Frankia sp. EI5c TaxID=683316 RepID=UPI0026F42E1D